MPKEPQSYGSQRDWVSGNVGGEVSRQKSGPDPQHADFYENRREKEHSGPHQGGHVSEQQASEQAGAPPEACDTFDDGSEGAKKVTDVEGGARRKSFFKERDYSR